MYLCMFFGITICSDCNQNGEIQHWTLDAIDVSMLTLVKCIMWTATEEELLFGIIINIYEIKLQWVCDISLIMTAYGRIIIYGLRRSIDWPQQNSVRQPLISTK